MRQRAESSALSWSCMIHAEGVYRSRYCGAGGLRIRRASVRCGRSRMRDTPASASSSGLVGPMRTSYMRSPAASTTMSPPDSPMRQAPPRAEAHDPERRRPRRRFRRPPRYAYFVKPSMGRALLSGRHREAIHRRRRQVRHPDILDHRIWDQPFEKKNDRENQSRRGPGQRTAAAVRSNHHGRGWFVAAPQEARHAGAGASPRTSSVAPGGNASSASGIAVTALGC